jgi:hypothetical protein
MLRISCKNCVYERVDSNKNPCAECQQEWNLPLYEPKDCDYCLYNSSPVEDESCRSCTDYRNFKLSSFDIDSDPTSDYDTLFEAFYDAFLRCSKGKGKERHAQEATPFEEQPIINNTFTEDAPLFQVYKKALEVPKIKAKHGVDSAMNEVLDIMVYAAAAYYKLKEQK